MSYLSNNINEMSMDSLLYGFQQRLKILVKENARKHMVEAQPAWIMDIIENEIQPLIDQIVDWEPSDDEITANNSCGTPWHDGCR